MSTRQRWECPKCHAAGDDASYQRLTRHRCPRCQKRVDTDHCASGMLCSGVGLQYDAATGTGWGVHGNPAEARRCEQRNARKV